MTSIIRTTVTRSTSVRTATVLGNVNGLGARMAGFQAKRPAAALTPGATPSRGYPEFDPSRERLDRDCQSHPSVETWQPAKAATPANPN